MPENLFRFDLLPIEDASIGKCNSHNILFKPTNIRKIRYICTQMRRYLTLIALLLLCLSAGAQKKQVLASLPELSKKSIERIDLDNDGDIDALKIVLTDGTILLWLDDDDDMTDKDETGDLDNDCILLDRNHDGKYDMVIKYCDVRGNDQADHMLIADYAAGKERLYWIIDDGKEGLFNCIDWKKLDPKRWAKDGLSVFYSTDSGNTSFIRSNCSSLQMKNLSIGKENPFIFYDAENDGLTEMTVRIFDDKLSGKASSMEICWDLGNDNLDEETFDYDLKMTYSAKDGGFDYSNCIHPLKNMRGLPEADKFFPDARIRTITQLVYPDFKQALSLARNGNWNSVKMEIRRTSGGAFDVESDNDFSGGGLLFVSEGNLHLNGAQSVSPNGRKRTFNPLGMKYHKVLRKTRGCANQKAK